MNQIICTRHCTINKTQNDIKPDKKKHLLKFQISFLFIVLISTFIYYFYFNHDLYSHEKVSRSLIDSYDITRIYRDNSDYSAKRIKTEDIFFYENSSFSIIGKIDIKKIDISYPILSDISKEFLKISPCRFYGPMPNEIGNVCIAAHNYKNNTFFSKLSKLEIRRYNKYSR